MPSKEELCVCDTYRSTTQDFLSRDVDELVAEIKENLRLSGLKSRPIHSGIKNRASPYKIPSRNSAVDSKCESCGSPRCTNFRSCTKKGMSKLDSDDPYEVMEQLLKAENLINEAVRRIQMNLTPKHRYFYDSEDDSKSPVSFKDISV